uniref:Putative secreted protein n=1 Tax=Lutzomyia longipalpis TaxID=7200 RepID=A0A7G3APG7_LUTLO
MAAWVSRKNNAYADTGFCGSFGSLFFFFFCTLGFLLAADEFEPFIPCIFPLPLGEFAESLISGSGDGRFNVFTGIPLSSLSSLVVPVSVCPCTPCGGDLPMYPPPVLICGDICGAICGDCWGGCIINI